MSQHAKPLDFGSHQPALCRRLGVGDARDRQADQQRQGECEEATAQAAEDVGVRWQVSQSTAAPGGRNGYQHA